MLESELLQKDGAQVFPGVCLAQVAKNLNKQ